MNVDTIQMSREEAKEKLDQYLRGRHKDTAAQYADCAVGYKALAEGKKLIYLDGAIRDAGLMEGGFPNLAIARADREEVRVEWSRGETVLRFDARAPSRNYSFSRGNPGSLVVRVDMKRHHGIDRSVLEGWAQVPLLPADVRPRTGQLRDWFILWDVQRWYARRDRIEPDRDPMLLEHLQGSLYAVLAEWDLTDLEVAVMAGALRAED